MWQKIKAILYNHILFFSLWLALVIIAFCTVKNYGISWDEQTQRYIGEKYCDYVFYNDTNFYTFPDRDHGGIFEMGLIAVEKLINSKDEKIIYTTRHIVSHIFFLICSAFFYFLIIKVFKQKYLALFAFFTLVLHPRIYAHSFFNSKDIPFLGLCIIALYSFYLAITHSKSAYFILLGLVCGLACSVRFLGIIFPLVFMIIFIFKAYLLDEKINWKGFLIFCFSGLISLFIFFPTLWHHPIQSFLYVINSLSVFRWQGHVLLNGTQIKSSFAFRVMLSESKSTLTRK